MAPRTNPERIRGPQLTPQAPGSYPVDPYNRPPSDSNLSRLASALGDLAPTLNRIAGSAMEGEKESAEKKAYADFLDLKKTGKAIKAGQLDPSGSPYFQRYYNEKLGQLAASRYESDMNVAASTALADETDPNNFDAFAADFREAWLKDNVGTVSNDFMAGFNPSAAGYDIASRNTFASAASARLQGKAIGTLYQLHQVAVTDILEAHAGVMDDSTVGAIAEAMKKANQHHYEVNPLQGKAISNTTVAAVFDLARNAQDTRILDVLKHIDSAVPGASLWTTQEVQSKLAELRNQIHGDIKKDDAFAEGQTKKERNEAVGRQIDTLSEALDASDDPSTVDVKPYADALTGISPKDKERLYKLKDAYVRRDQQETAAQAGPLFERALRGTLSFEQVADAFSVGQISKDTAKELRSLIRGTKSGKTKELVSDERYEKASSKLEKMFQNTMGAYSSPVTQALARIATWQLERDWVRFMSKPENAAQANMWLQQRSGELYIQYAGVPIKEGGVEQAASIVQGFLDQQNVAQLSDWKKTRLVSRNFLERIRSEQAASVAAGHDVRSDAVKMFLQGYRILAKDTEAFIQAQSTLPERPN